MIDQTDSHVLDEETTTFTNSRFVSNDNIGATNPNTIFDTSHPFYIHPLDSPNIDV